jgi:DNA gyrase subunit A
MSETNPNTPRTEGGVVPYDINEELKESYIAYAMSVIVSRALPDVRDGMKPVHRRILYAMQNMRLTHNAKYKKSASVVGEVLGKYHPHGDTAVYDAMVRLAQPFSMRYPLVDGQGNFGSIDGDGAAAMRYTEARLTKLAEEMMADLDQDTVDRRDNYDGSEQEPIMLSTKFPNHLCNGTMGIAVGMATNMAPHNLTEVVKAMLMLIEKPDATIEDIMKIIKGPDFPTAGQIFDPERILEVYKKGKGGIVMRGVHHYETDKKNNTILVITEIPYLVNKSNLVAKIGQLVVDKKLEGITDITDESSKDGIRITITIKEEYDADTILYQLYKSTDLQCNFNINNVTLIDSGIQPRLLNIKDLLEEYITFRRAVVERRSAYQLNKAQNRLHILEGLKKAVDIIDDVIALIRNSSTKDDAKRGLMDAFEFSEVQAEYILQMRLQSLV